MDLIDWLRKTCKGYEIKPIAVFARKGELNWPAHFSDEDALVEALEAGKYFVALPKEPAALANVIEVSIVDFLLERFEELDGINAARGTERGYPDIEISGDALGGCHAIDIKVARRAKNGRQTNSRITLYTGNTYFAHPQFKWPSTLRPFQEYRSHVDIIAIYTFNAETMSRIEDLEIIVQEPWKIASRKRSSTTREYLGAVMSIDDLRAGKGEFKSAEDFYKYWRAFKFKIPPAIIAQLRKLQAQLEKKDNKR